MARTAKRKTVAAYIALAADRLTRAIAAATRCDDITDEQFSAIRKTLRDVSRLERRIRTTHRATK